MSTVAVPYRWVEILSLDHAYSLLELEQMPDYGFTGATLWSSFEGLDNYYYTLPVVYRQHADLNALRDQNKIRSGIEFLGEFTRRAHRLGLTAFHGYHLCNFVGTRMDLATQLRTKNLQTGLETLRPDWFNAHGEPDFSRPGFYEFMATEVAEFFDQYPQVDGLYCWNCECSIYTPSRLKHQTVSKAEIAKRAMRAVYEVLQRRGKMMMHDIHTGGADQELSRGIIAAAAALPELIVGADATYSDWQLHLDTTPWLAEMKRQNRIYMGFDASGEFFGQGRTIAGWPRWLTKHFRAGQAHGLTAITVRSATIAKDNSCVLVPMLEFNLRVIAQLARHGTMDLDAELRAWWRRHFTGELPAGMTEVFLSFEEYLEKALYINGTNITTYNPDHSYDPRPLDVAPGYPVWHAEQFTKPGTPLAESMGRMIPPWGHQSRPVAALRQEKLDAIAICDRALAAIETMAMAEPDRAYFLRKLRQARDFAAAWLLTIEVVYPLYQIVGEHHDRSVTDPRAALRAALERYRAHATAIEERWGDQWYRRFAPKMQEFAAAIPEKLYA